MSSLSQFAPFAGGGIKSIQTGFVASGVSGGNGNAGTEDINYLDVTISSVNTAKSIPSGDVVAGTFSNSVSAAYNFSYFYYDSPFTHVTFRLTSATNLRIAGTYNAYLYGRWYVVEAN